MTLQNTTPLNATPFNLTQAQAGKPIVTRSGNLAKFIAYVPEATFHNQRVLFLLNGQIRSVDNTGWWSNNTESPNDLFMLEQTSTLNGFSYPSALTEHPDVGTVVYITDISSSYFSFDIEWSGEEYDIDVFNRGIVHLTQENAIAHAQAIILACGGTFE